MSWRAILGVNLETNPLTQNTHNTQNTPHEANCADIADIAYRGTNSKTANQPEIVRTSIPPAPAAEGMRNDRTPQPAPSAPKPITPRPMLRFKLRDGGGTVLGQPEDTTADLLADLIERWPGELLAVWNGAKQICPRPPLESG